MHAMTQNIDGRNSIAGQRSPNRFRFQFGVSSHFCVRPSRSTGKIAIKSLENGRSHTCAANCSHWFDRNWKFGKPECDRSKSRMRRPTDTSAGLQQLKCGNIDALRLTFFTHCLSDEIDVMRSINNHWTFERLAMISICWENSAHCAPRCSFGWPIKFQFRPESPINPMNVWKAPRCVCALQNNFIGYWYLLACSYAHFFFSISNGLCVICVNVCVSV